MSPLDDHSRKLIEDLLVNSESINREASDHLEEKIKDANKQIEQHARKVEAMKSKHKLRKGQKAIDISSDERTWSMEMEINTDEEDGSVVISQEVTESYETIFTAEVAFHGMDEEGFGAIVEDMKAEGISAGSLNNLTAQETIRFWSKQIKALGKFNKRFLND